MAATVTDLPAHFRTTASLQPNHPIPNHPIPNHPIPTAFRTMLWLGGGPAIGYYRWELPAKLREICYPPLS